MAKATKSNTQKLVCSITKDWAYATSARMLELQAKFGSAEKLTAQYVSRAGKKKVDAHVKALIPAGLEGDELVAAMVAARPQAIINAKAECDANPGKNKIFCILTRERMYISDDRMAKLMETGSCTEQEVRDGYMSRVARRLCKSLPMKMFQKEPAELTKEETAKVHAEIKLMADEGRLPAPSAPKGSVKAAAEAKARAEAEAQIKAEAEEKAAKEKADAEEKAAKAKTTKKAPAKKAQAKKTIVKDTTPDAKSKPVAKK